MADDFTRLSLVLWGRMEGRVGLSAVVNFCPAHVEMQRFGTGLPN
jgi:hypothetical protein